MGVSNDFNSREELLNAISLRLKILNVSSDDEEEQFADNTIIEFLIPKVESYIKNFCNISIIPEELFYVEVDLICGEFLKEKKSTGKVGNFDLSADVKSIQEGDTSITYGDVPSQDKKLDLLISKLLDKNEELLCYRKIKW